MLLLISILIYSEYFHMTNIISARSVKTLGKIIRSWVWVLGTGFKVVNSRYWIVGLESQVLGSGS